MHIEIGSEFSFFFFNNVYREREKNNSTVKILLEQKTRKTSIQQVQSTNKQRDFPIKSHK